MNAIRAVALSALALALAAPAAGAAEEQPMFTVDEKIWVAFYDVPSRRFRSIRDAFIRGDLEAASGDLETSIGFLTLEASRAVADLQRPLSEVIAQLDSIRERIHEPTVAVGQLDGVFARAHWLLAQHYLVLALQSQSAARHKSAGRYLWATAHHLERAVLWSDARVDRSVLKSLDSIRDLSNRLQTDNQPERVYRERPVRLTARTLIAVGRHLDRRVWVEDVLPKTDD